MRIFPVISVVVLLSAVPAAALACGGEKVQRPVEPTFVVAPPSNSELLVRAERLDRMADSVVERARHAERRAAALSARARELREVAFDTDGVERSNLLIAAGEMSLRATQERRMAQRGVVQARDLRTQARVLRVRANNVTGGERTWQRRSQIRRTRPLI
jgi:hypothetical protein